MPYKKIKVPKKGSKITFENGKINIPDNPIIPYIEGDGIGVDITPPMINVVNEAVKIAYKDKKKNFSTLNSLNVWLKNYFFNKPKM